MSARINRVRWMTLVIVLFPLAAWRVWREIPPLLVSGQIGFVPTDFWHESSSSHNKVRVLITDQGALGWGCISVYDYTLLTGYERRYRGCPAVSGHKDIRVEWIDDKTVMVVYKNPNEGGLVSTTLAVR